MIPERAPIGLRALRGAPQMLDDRAVAVRLAAGSGDAVHLMGDGFAESLRWARAWLVSAHAALVADPRYGRDDPWTIAVLVSSIVAPKGRVSDGARAEALRRLADADVISIDEGVEVRFARALFAEHVAALGIDWRGVVEGVAAEPSALLVARVLADLLVPLDGWTATPRRDLVARTGYGQKQVRLAVRRLVSAGVLEADGETGMTARYRFTAMALGRAWIGVDGRGAGASTPRTDGAARVAGAEPSSATATGVQLVLGGVRVEVQPGAELRVEAGFRVDVRVGSDGVPLLIIEPSR